MVQPRVSMFCGVGIVVGAIVQSFVLGNSYGSNKFEWRFTSFTGAQSFAPFLLCLIVLLLFSKRWTLTTVAAGLGGLAGLILTGSRSVFLGLLWVLFISGFLMATRAGQRVNFRLVLRRTVMGIVSICAILAVVVTQLPDNRLNEMLWRWYPRTRPLMTLGRSDGASHFTKRPLRNWLVAMLGNS